MIVRDDIHALYDTELEGKDMGIAPYNHTKENSIRKYNSGMMLIDLERRRTKNIGEKVIKHVRDNINQPNMVYTDEG